MNNLWYQSLNKSVLTPNPIAFKIVWGVLYIMVFTALVIYLAKGVSKKDTSALILFVINIALNFVWYYVFFVMQNIGASFLITALIVVTLIPVIILFSQKSKTAAGFLIAYLAWLVFALYLNFELLIRN